MTADGVHRASARGLGLRILALVTDAHGGFGGISQYNRDALEAMCSYDTVGEVHVLPRLVPHPLGKLPEKLVYHLDGLRGALSYAKSTFRVGIKLRPVDLIYCAHVNLVPAAVLLGKALGAPIVLAIYGVDVWQSVRRTPSPLLRSSISAVVSISEITLDRFLAWCPFSRKQTFIVPNAIRLEEYGAAPKNEQLMAKYGLTGRTVLMTLGRMASEERLKGFDRIIELMPQLATEIPNVVYLAVGDGSDRPRLEAKAASLGVADRVIFTGRIDDSVKGDVYRLADVYVMPSMGEGFGFVVVEALASGVPVVVSARDGTREAVRDGRLGIVVEPSDLDSIRRGIHQALRKPRLVPPGLTYFSYERFCERLHSALASVCPI